MLPAAWKIACSRGAAASRSAVSRGAPHEVTRSFGRRQPRPRARRVELVGPDRIGQRDQSRQPVEPGLVEVRREHLAIHHDQRLMRAGLIRQRLPLLSCEHEMTRVFSSSTARTRLGRKHSDSNIEVRRVSDDRLFGVQRHERVLDELRRHGAVRVKELAELLGVSELTIRRDIAALADAEPADQGARRRDPADRAGLRAAGRSPSAAVTAVHHRHGGAVTGLLLAADRRWRALGRCRGSGRGASSCVGRATTGRRIVGRSAG